MWLKSVYGDIVNAQRISKNRVDTKGGSPRCIVLAHPGKLLLLEKHGAL